MRQWKKCWGLSEYRDAERVEIIQMAVRPHGKQSSSSKLVKDLPDTKELLEYEDYLSHPTKATASALITLTLESNWDRVQGMEGYAKYIALRPGGGTAGEHACSVIAMPLTSPLSRTNWITIPATCGRTSSPSTGRMLSGWGMTMRTHGAITAYPSHDIAAAMKNTAGGFPLVRRLP